MRILPALFLLLTALAGCTGAPDPPGGIEPSPLGVYRFTWDGADVAVEGVEHGWLLRVQNQGDRAVRIHLGLTGVQDALYGPVGQTAGGVTRDVWLPGRVSGGEVLTSPAMHLAPGGSGVLLVRVEAYAGEGPVVGVGFRLFAIDPTAPQRIIADLERTWNVTRAPAAQGVSPGDHVRTATVGVWTNGTAFYTNIASLLADPDFLHPFPRDAATQALSLYVYDSQRGEQPAGSLDACRGTTIAGYNRLLKTQAEGSTGVAFLAPEMAYTWEGNEDHLLYGDALVFLNTIVSHDGATGTLDELPDPDGPCWPASVERLLAEALPAGGP